MIPRVSINMDRTTIAQVWDHYEAIRDGIVRSAEIAKQNLSEGAGSWDPKLFGKSLSEVERLLDEADKQASLFLIAAAEAALRVDFWQRVSERRKDSVSRAFRNICKSRYEHSKGGIRLEEDILDTWVTEVPGTKNGVGKFKGALKFRHWLAHGRYWVPKLGRTYDPNGLILIVKDLFGRMGVTGN